MLVEALTGRVPVPIDAAGQLHRRHRFHRWAHFAPFVFRRAVAHGMESHLFGHSCHDGGRGTIRLVSARPDQFDGTGWPDFLPYYVIFLVSLEVTAPSGYIKAVWNLEHPSGIVLGFMPLEELLFAIGFGTYWAGVYEHVTWSRSDYGQR